VGRQGPAGASGGQTVARACPRTRGSATDVAVSTALPALARHLVRSTPVAETVATVVSLEVHLTSCDTSGSASTTAWSWCSQSGSPKLMAGGSTTTDRTSGASGRSSSLTLRTSVGSAYRHPSSPGAITSRSTTGSYPGL
jgi:hypothetical protein